MSEQTLTPTQIAQRIKASPVADMLDAVLVERMAKLQKQLLKVEDYETFMKLRARLNELNYLRSIMTTKKGNPHELLDPTP